MICSSCGAESAAGMSFCGHCGAGLERRHQLGERRQLTVLFCDLVGSTAIAEALDPEDYGELLSEFQGIVRRAVEGHGGHIAQLLGDGVLVYFGYPVSHENSPDLAVAAALAAVRALERRREQTGASGRPVLAVRIGIHTGPVVIDPRSNIKERRNLALGNTPNVAARLQQLAEPGGILMSEDTRRLLHTDPPLRDLGARELKGLSKAVGVFAVLAGAGDAEPPSGVRRFSPSPMVNREGELAALASYWRQVRAGRGRAVLIEGDAGVGKSRLASHFATGLDGGAEILTTGCSALRQGSALFPLHQLIRAQLELAPGDEAEHQLATLRADLEAVGLGASLAPLAAFLRLPAEDRLFAQASPELRRRETHAALRGWVLSRAAESPAVLIFEDLHWGDPSSLDWLETLLGEIESTPLLVLMTGRPGSLGSVEWTGCERVVLGGLEEGHARQLIAGITGSAKLSAAGLERLCAQTDGVPLYLEELTRGVLEALPEDGRAAEEWTELGIPSSLQDLLTARLDRLDAGKGLAQWAAVLGRTFPLASLRRLAAGESADFDRELSDLVATGILERETASGRRFRFRHAMMQEAAYHSLLKTELRERHRTIAELFAAGGPGISAGPSEVAHHFAEADLPAAAAEWWRRAGEEALARSENEEAIGFLRRGIAALAGDGADGGEALLLDLEGALATALTAVRGYASEEVEQLHGSVGERAGRLGDSREIFSGLRNTLPFYLVRAQHPRARAIGEELVEMATRLGDQALLLEARVALATACFWLGEAEESRRQAELGLAIYRREDHAAHAVEFGQDPGTLCHLYAAWSAWWLGSFTVARRHLERALELARSLGHPHSLAMALDHGCSLRLYLQEWREARELVTEQLEISTRYGFSMWAAMGGFRSAWLDCLDGELAGGIARMEAGLAAFRATGAEIARPLHLSYLAHAHLLAGSGAAGLATIDEALAAAESNNETHYLAELHRLRGELELVADGGGLERGRKSLRTAVEIARRQGARALELRAALSWHRVATGSEAAAAADDLRRVTESLAETGDAPDLDAARASLAAI